MTWRRSTSLGDLDRALDTFDRDRVHALCDDLVEDLRTDPVPYPLDGARAILRSLRARRRFGLLRRVAEAFLQSGVTAPTIRRQYAQALLDLGVVTGGVAVLRDLLADLRADPAADGYETTECLGLLGRAYKQMYVSTGPATTPLRRRLLELSVEHYGEVYHDTGHTWHGINLAAMLLRGRRDGVELPGDDPHEVARAVLDEVHALGDRATTWDLGTAVEACLALGDFDEAVRELDVYLASDVEAFQIASTLRQLRQVWQLDAEHPPGSHLIPLLDSRLLAGEQVADVVVGAAELRTSLVDVQDNIEKILGAGKSFASLKWFRTGLERCRTVALIEDLFGEAKGTGFLVDGKALRPGWPDAVLITNDHVVSVDTGGALRPDQATATFRALEDDRSYRVEEVLWRSPRSRLDIAVLALDGRPDQAELCPIAPNRPLPDDGQPPRTYIIGHPRGTAQVMLSLRDNQMLDADDTLVHYRTPTHDGSSGSPVFNEDWRLIAVHRAGANQMTKLNGKAGLYPANEGVWFDRIIAELAGA